MFECICKQCRSANSEDAYLFCLSSSANSVDTNFAMFECIRRSANSVDTDLQCQSASAKKVVIDSAVSVCFFKQYRYR